MSKSTEQQTLEMEKVHDAGIAPSRSNEVNITHLIDKLASTPNITLEHVAIVERLVALQERKEAQERRDKFFDALTRVQKKVPRIAQNGVMVRGEKGGKILYSTREDIDAEVRPIYQAEGFSVTWNAPVMPDGKIRIVGSFTCHGHTEEREWSCLPDPSGGKTGPQAVSSTLAYGKRQVSKEFWDIVEEGKDLNGASRKEDVTAISQAQADDLRTLLNDMPNPKAAFKRLYEIYGITKLEDMRIADLDDAHKRIQSAKEAK